MTYLMKVYNIVFRSVLYKVLLGNLRDMISQYFGRFRLYLYNLNRQLLDKLLLFEFPVFD